MIQRINGLGRNLDLERCFRELQACLRPVLGARVLPGMHKSVAIRLSAATHPLTGLRPPPKWSRGSLASILEGSCRILELEYHGCNSR
jgi:hypothetical protein